MSEAEAAYAAAVAEIARVKAEGEWKLILSGPKFAAMETLPDEIVQLDGVTWLDLRGTQISDEGLAQLQGMKALQLLILSQTQISDAGVQQLQAITELRSLDLSGTQITDAGLVLLQGMTKLDSLYLGGTQISNAGLAKLQGMTALQTLFLAGPQIGDAGLAQLQGMKGLLWLYLGGTQIGDAGLAHLQEMTQLQFLYLSGTGISDAGLEQLQGMTDLQLLDLEGTQIISIAALAGFPELYSLDLTGTGVRDLRPICDLPMNGDGPFWGLRFANTPAAALDPRLGELAQIEDNAERTTKTLEYLRGLPKYPAPLPWLGGDEIPVGKPAPLQVVERDGKLVALRSATELSDASDLMAAQAWAALRDFLEDMADQRGRIHNMMPTMARALARFEAALSTRFDLCDAIALGMHGDRVIALAPNAAEYLSNADAVEVSQFAAAIALFLERFPAWRAYRDDAKPPTYSAQDIADVVPLIRALDAKLRDYVEIDPEIPNQLDLLAEAAMDAPAERLASRGLLDSVGNVLSALATKALTVVKIVAKQGVKMTWAATKTILDKGTDVALNLTATDFFLNNAENLTRLAAKLPAVFEWLSKFLSTLPF